MILYRKDLRGKLDKIIYTANCKVIIDDPEEYYEGNAVNFRYDELVTENGCVSPFLINTNEYVLFDWYIDEDLLGDDVYWDLEDWETKMEARNIRCESYDYDHYRIIFKEL